MTNPCRKTMLQLLVVALLASPVLSINKKHGSDKGYRSSSPYGKKEETDRLLKKRVVGGSLADMSRYPYFTYLMIETSQGLYECGGVLIHYDIVLSAAHCVEGVDVYSITAIVNMTEHYYPVGVVASYYSEASNSLTNTGYEQIRKVEDFHQHPNYFQPTESNDIVVLQLSDPVFGVPFPSLPAPSMLVADGTPVTVVGLGDTTGRGDLADRLMEVEVDVVNHDYCHAAYDKQGQIIDEEIMICAARTGKDACQGDSGGPLVIKSDNGNLNDDVVIGLVSFGTGCAHAKYPGVYSRISGLDDFIVAKGLCSMSQYGQPNELFCASFRDDGDAEDAGNEVIPDDPSDSMPSEAISSGAPAIDMSNKEPSDSLPMEFNFGGWVSAFNIMDDADTDGADANDNGPPFRDEDEGKDKSPPPPARDEEKEKDKPPRPAREEEKDSPPPPRPLDDGPGPGGSGGPNSNKNGKDDKDETDKNEDNKDKDETNKNKDDKDTNNDNDKNKNGTSKNAKNGNSNMRRGNYNYGGMDGMGANNKNNKNNMGMRRTQQWQAGNRISRLRGKRSGSDDSGSYQ